MPEPTRRGRKAFLAALTAALVTLTGCATSTSTTTHHSTAAATHRPPSPSRPPAPPASAWNPHPTSIAALGDSISRGFDACSLLADCPQVSWSTGDQPGFTSLASQLLAQPQGHTWNFAATGAQVADLSGQAQQAAQVKPALATILIGANDACSDTVAGMTSVTDFRTEFTSAMDTLHTSSPTTEVYVSSVPNLQQLWSVGRSNALGAQIWQLGLCPSMLSDADDLSATAQARRTAVEQRVEAYNSVLQEVCAKYTRCRYDGGAVFNLPLTTDELSTWDWFHPNVQGQEDLARIAYANITRK
jgi:lysophospholipase L1-like esterase